MATNRLEDSRNVDGAALHVGVNLLADDEGSAAISFSIASDRPDIDKEDIVIAQARTFGSEGST